MKTISIMLIEDNRQYSDVLSLAFQNTPGMELTHQFGTAEIAIRTLQEGAITDHPDLILLDLRLPGTSGLDAIPLLKKCSPETKIIVLTQSNHEEDVLRAISSGASGYLLKSSKLDSLIEGVRTVMNGGASLDANIAKFILDALRSKLSIAPTSDEPDETRILSDRELEILTLLAEGHVKKEIAKRLDIRYTTVDTHVGRIYAKLDVTNAPSAVNKAHRLNLFDDDK